MRVKIAGPKKARRGQTVRFHFALRKGVTDHAFCEVYSSVGDFEPSPHVALAKMEIRKSQPDMFAATTVRLTPKRTSHIMEIVADENCAFYIMQDVDTVDDPRIKGRITADGKLKTLFNAVLRRWRRSV